MTYRVLETIITERGVFHKGDVVKLSQEPAEWISLGYVARQADVRPAEDPKRTAMQRRPTRKAVV